MKSEFAKRVYYLETSFWGMLVSGQPQSLRSDTRRLLQSFKQLGARTLISQVVLEEIEPARTPERQTMLEAVQQLGPRIIALEVDISKLAELYIDAGIVPRKKRNDALHVAAASSANADILVSWNYRHLVRPRKAEQFCAVNLLHGYNPMLEISSPAELLYGEGTNIGRGS